MPLSLITTAGAVDANGYASQARTIARAQYKPGGAGSDAALFLALTSDQQIQCIVTGAIDIDSTDGLIGDKSSDSQAMQFPRDGDTTIAADIESANMELAISYAPRFTDDVTGDAVSPAASNIKREKLDVVETEYFAATEPSNDLSRFPAIVQRLLARFVAASSATGWGSATVSRGS